MAVVLLYTSDNVDIFHHRADGWLYVSWKGYQSVDLVMAGCEEMLRQLTRFKLTKVLNDNTRVEGIWVGAAAWMAKDWFPRMRKAGLRYFAWVQSPSRLSHISASTTVDQTEPGTAMLFESLTEASAWLRQQPVDG